MKKHILVAEDDSSILEVVNIILNDAGHTVAAANNKNEFLKAIAKKQPDLIFLDIWLSGEDGSILAKKLKENENTKNIPIVILSANNDTALIAKQVGADDFLLKPFDIDDLTAMVNKYLQ